jgi:signal transduction histidine kinase
MTVSGKVMLFTAIATIATAFMGGTLYRLASQGGLYMQSVLVRQEQGHHCAALKSDALDYVEELLLAGPRNEESQAILAKYELRAQQDFERLRFLEQELRGEAPSPASELPERLQREHHQWLRWTHALVSGAPVGQEEALLRQVLERFSQQVEPPLQQLWSLRRDEVEQLNQQRRRELQLGALLGVFSPLLLLVLVGGLAIAILRPMNRSLQALVKGAERIGHGDVGYRVPSKGRDEFSTLAAAFNRMASQVHESLVEKERLVRAEAELSEREMLRTRALLEETVRTRTLELETANARLKESLQRVRFIQDQMLFSERLATIGQLAASISHEINNPLAYLISNLHFSQEEIRRTQGNLSATECQNVQEALAEACDGAERVRLIVQDLKLMLHQGSIERGSTDLAAAVRSAMKMAAHEIRHRARLVEQLDGIPPVHGNSARLSQVFLNLLLNAAQAIPPGNVAQNEIKIVARVSGPEHVVVTVSDTGSGISPEHIKRIFDPFFTTKPQGKGSGLGLSVCHSIITAHGGEISVESQAGRGTTFQIVLPLYTGKHTPTPPPVILFSQSGPSEA